MTILNHKIFWGKKIRGQICHATLSSEQDRRMENCDC